MPFAKSSPPGIPTHLTPLVGREQELAELLPLLRCQRLLTLVGAGGIGKTRVATALAVNEQMRGDARVAWVDLSAITEPALVPHHVATALGVREQPGRSPVDRIIESIGDGETLVVLDTCEHLLAACAQLAQHLLRSLPALRILATSRQALGVTGEKAWLVPPLACEGTGEVPLDEVAAVALFTQRASDALPSFRLTDDNRDAVHRIVRRLDGVPLAIELAAARIKLLPPEQLASRLDDAFSVLATRSEVVLPRHRTLRALIDWSYALLTPEERLLFERLAVFAGGFTLEAAESITAYDGVGASELLELLAALVDKSLVVVHDWRSEARYALRDTVRQYALERLRHGADGAAETARESALRCRHASWFVRFAERAASEMHAPRQLDWLARLEAEHENIRLALRGCVERCDTDHARRLCLALRDFWRLRGHLSEGRRWMEEALALPGADDAMRARALVFTGVMSRMQGDHEGFRQGVIAGEALARSVGDRAALADALTHLGVDQREQGQLDRARALLDEAIVLWRALGDAWGLTQALGVQSSIAHAGGDLARSRALRLEAVEVSRAAGDREGEARALIGLGEVARLEGDFEGARAYYERCLAIFHELGDTWHSAAVSHNLGWVFVETARPAEAQAAFEDSLSLFTLAGNKVGLALCAAGYAGILLERGDPETATVSLAAASARFAQEGVRPSPADDRSWVRTQRALEQALGTERFGALWERGRTQGLEESAAWAQEKLRMSDASLRTSGTFRVPSAEPPAAAGAGLPEAELRVPADLRVFALGPLRILLDDEPLAGEAFGSSKPRELLLLLLCHPEGRTREQVGLAFWPDSSAAQVKNRFHVTLHRLRKALQHPEWIVASGDRYRLDAALRVQFDAALFEEGVTTAMRARCPDSERIERLGAALALYRGDFLEGETVGDWHFAWRDRLQVLFLDARLAQGDLLARAGRWDEAVVAFRAILARDPLHEEATRRLMEGLVALGDRSQAAHVYHELTAALERDLGVDPDERTTAAFLRLQAR